MCCLRRGTILNLNSNFLLFIALPKLIFIVTCNRISEKAMLYKVDIIKHAIYIYACLISCFGPSLHYQSFCDHSKNFAQVSSKF